MKEMKTISFNGQQYEIVDAKAREDLTTHVPIARKIADIDLENDITVEELQIALGVKEVDQTFDPESENAQSGLAIAGALKKYAKIYDAQGYVFIEWLFENVAHADSKDYRNIIKFHGVIGDENSNTLLQNGDYLCFGTYSSIACWACDENVLYTIKRIYDSVNGAYTYEVTSSRDGMATKEYVDNIVDSVNSALDEIHAYAESIISGGEEV